MRPIVRDLYKRFLIAGRQHPQGLEYVKERVKKEFFENANILSKVSNDAINISRYNIIINSFSHYPISSNVSLFISARR